MPIAAATVKRAADGRRADRPLDGAHREVARAELARSRREPLEVSPLEADPDLPVEHADRRRDRACGANGGLAREARLDAVRRREAVGDEGRLERDDRALFLEGGLHLVADADQVVHHRASLDDGLRHRPGELDAACAGGESQLRSADEPAGGEGIACAGRVDDRLDGNGG